MASSTKVVNTTLNHWLDPAKGGHSEYRTGTAGYYRRKFDPQPVQIHDIRGREDQFSLDVQGFEYHQHVSVEKDFTDDEHVKQVVYPETEELMKKYTGATRVHIWSHITRRSSREQTEQAVLAAKLEDNVSVPNATPARLVHIDQSNDGAVQILNDNMPPELAEKLSKTRWAIINVWRPIRPISKDPLALCDARSVPDEDLMKVRSIPPKGGNSQYRYQTAGRYFELFYAKYNPVHKWYYVDSMNPDEVLFIKCFDSIRDGKTARRAPHSAFTNPDTTEDATRESIEIRCLVFFEDQPN